MSRKTLSSFPRRMLATATTVAICALAAPAFSGNLWQPLCPDRTLCATAVDAYVANGRVLMSSSDPANIPSQWVTIDSLHGMPTAMHDVTVSTSGERYVGARGSLFNAYNANGTFLYGGTHSSFESWLFFEKNATVLGPAVLFAGTSPATIFTGLVAPQRPATIYLSRNEGETVTTQQANVTMDGGRTNFIPGANGQRVWVNPGPSTPGLWQTPIATGNTQLDFTKLTRVDDGSYPDDVVRLRMIPSNLLNAGGYAVALAADGMYISTNFGKTWNKSASAGVVDDIAFPSDTSADVQVIAARGSVFVSNDRGQSWSEMGGGLPGDHYNLTATNGGVVADGVGGVFVCRALDCGGRAFGKIVTTGDALVRVTEFYNTVLDHYFITADEDEKGFVRNGGAGAGWVETGQSFAAWAPSVTKESAFVCRFYGDPVKGPNSHFYSASTDECRFLLGLQVRQPDDQPKWNSEGYSFKVSLPDDSQQCAAGLLPVHRAYNDGFARGGDSNHRFVLDKSQLTPLLAQGWKDEGIAFCVPGN
jgi:hypothetical protein